MDRAATLRALAALDDTSRRRLYDTVRAADAPLTREQAAEAIGISRKLAAFHLDKLVDAGLLVADFDPAARHRTLGRTPKTYRASNIALQVSIPQRRAEALAALLLEAVQTARPHEAARDAVLRASERAGLRAGAQARSTIRPGRLGAERALTISYDILAAHGYEPSRASARCLRLRNCPYAPLAQQAADLVCGLNQRYLAGLLHGLGATTVEAVLAPSESGCCVELHG